MKHSLRTKITLILTTMVILTILITWFTNNAFLEKYYMHIKQEKLYEAYNEVAELYEKSPDYNLSDARISQIEQLETNYSVDVYVLNSEKKTIFPESNNIGPREKIRTEDIEMIFFGFISPDNLNWKIEKNENDFLIVSYYNKQLASSFIDLMGIFEVTDKNTVTSDDITGEAGDSNSDTDNPNLKTPSRPADKSMIFIYLRSNYGSIKESVKIANEFLAYVGIIAAVIGSIAMFIITKSFTRPILVLSGIAKKMTDLDFEVKYKVKSKDEIGELGSCINTLSDKLESTITELKQANNELLTDIQRKTEIDEIRKEFLSNVSHELKTPIALIQGYAEGLKENINEDEESRDYYCEVIMDEANKMNNMVKKLLSLNELEFGNNQVNFERFDIVALIKSVLNATEILFKQKDVTLHFEQEIPIYVWADEVLIEQVVTNYISNALNHLSGQKIIEIKLIPKEDTVRVAVFNTGNNIPEEELDKIWIKFYKIDKARTREYGGSGIGLSIVKAIMNSHNKECGVINRHIGVEFWFELDTKS